MLSNQYVWKVVCPYVGSGLSGCCGCTIPATCNPAKIEARDILNGTQIVVYVEHSEECLFYILISLILHQNSQNNFCFTLSYCLLKAHSVESVCGHAKMIQWTAICLQETMPVVRSLIIVWLHELHDCRFQLIDCTLCVCETQAFISHSLLKLRYAEICKWQKQKAAQAFTCT